ncbi:MAG: hypothetical protein RL026_743 [Pseudomonadota bacterium]|jgi:chemotaxis protein MotB
MAVRRRRTPHEDHINHEAWAIPYGDLVTLLLAFFVVMYALSTVNEGKYRVLSESLNAAFRGTPTAPLPVQTGDARMAVPLAVPPAVPVADASQMQQLADELEVALGELVQSRQVTIRRHERHMEIDIGTDVLFASGVATLSPSAAPVMAKVATTLRRFDKAVLIEGHTDNQPISTAQFPSNWELSAARAASVVHLLVDNGVDPARLGVSAFSEYRPIRPNDTTEGRGANRRVVLLIRDPEPAGTDPASVLVEAAPPAR